MDISVAWSLSRLCMEEEAATGRGTAIIAITFIIIITPTTIIITTTSAIRSEELRSPPRPSKKPRAPRKSSEIPSENLRERPRPLRWGG